MLRKNVEKRTLLENLDGVLLAMDEIVEGARIEGGPADAIKNWLTGHVALDARDKLNLDFSNWTFGKGQIVIPLVGNEALQKIVGPDAAGDYVYLKNLDERTVALIRNLQAADKKKRTARSARAGNQ